MVRPLKRVARAARPLRRRVNQVLGRDLPTRVQQRCATLTLGSAYGGWTICPDGLDADSIVYSFGVGRDVSFDLAVIERFGATVHAFDPTPVSVQWVAERDLPAQFVFRPLGLAGFDGTATFKLPPPGWDSYSMVGSEDAPATTVEAPVNRLSTVMVDLGHSRVDVLKMDIEGAEYAALEDILAAGVPIGQLLVEFHHRIGDRPSLDRTRQAIEALSNHGYRIFSISPLGFEYSFARAKEG